MYFCCLSVASLVLYVFSHGHFTLEFFRDPTSFTCQGGAARSAPLRNLPVCTRGIPTRYFYHLDFTLSVFAHKHARKMAKSRTPVRPRHRHHRASILGGQKKMIDMKCHCRGGCDTNIQIISIEMDINMHTIQSPNTEN